MVTPSMEIKEGGRKHKMVKGRTMRWPWDFRGVLAVDCRVSGKIQTVDS